ncbi:LamG domain-containing protein, partial [Candidatus Poribacteria bacterium]|nr:LamG domain-containing protein [Candidatus Poribacteria bacterium]
MRVRYFGVSVLAALLLCGSAQADLPKDIVLYINFDEGKGDKLVDHSIYGHTLDRVAGKEKWVAGKYAGAMEFDGATAFQTKKSDILAKFDSTISVGAWVKPIALTGWTNIVEMDGPANAAWKVGFNNALLVFTTYRVKDHNGATNLALDKWQHVAYTYDGKSAKMYIDGKLDKDEPGAGTIKTADAGTPTLDVGWRSGSKASYLSGILDDLWISNVVKSEKEINTLMGGINLAVDAQGKTSTTWGAIKA